MADARITRKVTPVGKSAKYNNFFGNFNLAQRLSYLIHTELLIGVNRFYLFDNRNTIFWIAQLFVPFLLGTIIYLGVFSNTRGATNMVFINTSCIEFILLSISATYLQGKKLRSFFNKMSTFDTQLKLDKEHISPHQLKSFTWSVIIMVIVVIEYTLMRTYVYQNAQYTLNVIYLGILIHHGEKFFFCSLLYTVLTRIRVLRAQVAKVFCVKDSQNTNRVNKYERLAKHVELDISSLHKVYELLHESSEDLNESMSFSMIVMLFSSGITTIMLLKHLFTFAQIIDVDPTIKPLLMIYAIGHCIKLTMLMVIPCYLSNNITEHVTVIRMILHDAIDSKKQVKEERRKIKAFYQLTSENDFAYVLWGLIKLDMSLPLSYSSLCTTYLVIVLQFSKFID